MRQGGTRDAIGKADERSRTEHLWATQRDDDHPATDDDDAMEDGSRVRTEEKSNWELRRIT